MCGYVGIGRQAWLRAKWGFPVRVRVSLAAPHIFRFGNFLNLNFFLARILALVKALLVILVSVRIAIRLQT